MNRARLKHSKRGWIFLIPIALLGAVLLAIRLGSGNQNASKGDGWQAGPMDMNALDLAWRNYGTDVQRIAEEYDLPAEYLLALSVLECSGRKPAGSRFEPGVFEKLKAVRSGDRRKYENVRRKHLKDASDQALQNLATSWGPFQLMGYKCIGLEVNVRDIRGEDAVRQGVRWINEEYGKFLRKDKFKDAFHFHNTGRKYPAIGGPRTHDPAYVSNGIKYMDWFREKLETSQ